MLNFGDIATEIVGALVYVYGIDSPILNNIEWKSAFSFILFSHTLAFRTVLVLVYHGSFFFL